MINGVIGSGNVLPILEDFLFEIEGGQLKISATDLDTSMATSVEVTAQEDGRIAIPAKILVETLKTLAEQPLTFSVNADNFGVEITSDNGKYKLAGENPENFPKIPEAEELTELNIPSSALGNAISKTLFAIGTDELRPAMTGLLFQADSEGLTFVSTDAHKLVKYKRLDVKSDVVASFVVPKKAINLLKGSLPASNETSVSIGFDSNNVFFQFDQVQLISRLIDSKYPDYHAVIPQNNTCSLTIGRRELQNSLRRIAIYANKTTHQVVLGMNASEVKVSAQDLDFSNEAAETLACTYDGEPMDMAFNARFLVEMLGVLDFEEIKIELSVPQRPGIIVPTEDDGTEELLMLVMPVMINTPTQNQPEEAAETA